MSDYDLTNNLNHPLGTTDDPVLRGQRERDMFGAGKESPPQPSESHWDYQKRIHGKH